jgi:gamma-glutamylputrescine oxidase
MKENSFTPSFWEREEWLKKCDLLIVGAGIVGSSVALFYKERHPHADIVVIDRGFHPLGASTRNAGFACIGSISEHLADMEISGTDTVMNRIVRRWNGLQLLRSRLSDDETAYEHTGGIEIFTDRARYEKCRAKVEEMNRLLEASTGLGNVYSGLEYEGYPAIRNRVEGALNSGRMMKSLHQKLQQAGVRIYWNAEAEQVNPGEVHLKNGTLLKAENIVLATNGFTPRLHGEPVKPARGYVFVTHPLKQMNWKGTFHFNEGFVYFRNVGSRLLLGGGRDQAKEEETTDHFGVNPAIKEYLVKFANNVLKLEDGWEIDLEWSGIMGMTDNKEPIIRQAAPGLYVAAGLSGMGVAIGMQVAQEMVHLVQEGQAK